MLHVGMSVEEVMAMAELHLVSEEELDGHLFADYESDECFEQCGESSGVYFEFEDGLLVEFGGMAWV